MIIFFEFSINIVNQNNFKNENFDDILKTHLFLRVLLPVFFLKLKFFI